MCSGYDCHDGQNVTGGDRTAQFLEPAADLHRSLYSGPSGPAAVHFALMNWQIVLAKHRAVLAAIALYGQQTGGHSGAMSMRAYPNAPAAPADVMPPHQLLYPLR
jgi:hypothetical protein